MNDLQKHLLKMLKAFIEVCEKHHLTYFMCGGTCLGALRHNGFIPWDDDVDVMMPRDDYDKFVTLQDEFKGTSYFIQTWKTDPRYQYCFAKVRDSNTTYIENFFAAHHMNHGVWIDVFPLDGLSYKDKKRERCAHRLKFVWYMGYMSYLPNLIRPFRKETFFKDLGLNIVGGLTYIFDAFHWRQRVIERHCRHYKFDKAILIGTYYDFNTKVAAMPAHIFKEYTYADFEDIKVKVPKDYETYLTLQYGDWRTPPPVNKQVGGHHDKGFSLTTGYKEYMKEHRI